MFFGDGRRHVVREAKIEGDRRCDPPIIFDVRTVDFPASAGDGALIRLVMNGKTGDPLQEIGFRIAREVQRAIAGKVTGDAVDPKAILESLSADVHLIGPIVDTKPEVMLIVDVVEG